MLAPAQLHRTRVFGVVVTVAILGAALYPLSWPIGRDSFPLSSYPMFASRRSTEVRLTYALGIEFDGTRHHLAPALVANAEVLQAAAVLRQADRAGAAARATLCEQIASRVAVDHDLRGVIAVQLVRGRHDAIDYTVYGIRGPEETIARCEVPR